ncbi:MAG: S8 family serine peptidase, partial [Verrucomicrobiaceae bacterium]|nr:S8 family serine peptidase [Verrucomicrobiaceae bacterium]
MKTKPSIRLMLIVTGLMAVVCISTWSGRDEFAAPGIAEVEKNHARASGAVPVSDWPQHAAGATVQASATTAAAPPAAPATASPQPAWVFQEFKAVQARAADAVLHLRKFSPSEERPDFGWQGQGFSPEHPLQLQRDALAAWHEARFWQAKAHAWEVALAKGWAVKGPGFELMRIDTNGTPLYATTTNANARISTGVTQTQNVSPYNTGGALTGSIFRVGVWDGGSIRTTHQEFGSRASVMDGSANDDHATHVGGTIGAAGVQAAALGMAPAVSLRSYDWNSDVAELLSAGATTATSLNTAVGFSNHSYGWISGWDEDGGVWRWYGRQGDRESDLFGRYSDESRDYDDLATKIPFTLIFKSAGNDRNDSAPSSGTSFTYVPGGTVKAYNSTTDPFNDGYDSGYDTIGGGFGSSKNIMTVGAANDAVSAGVRNPSSATITSFSGFGPVDDGRVKPDIVANGASLYSPLSGSTTAYGNYSGTSMSTPNATGSAVLLQELYWRNFSNTAMRADLLKALIIHTADDIGNAGPDYTYGWGLMNVKAAADLILSHKATPAANTLVLGMLNNTTATSATYQFEWNGSGPLRVTL